MTEPENEVETGSDIVGNVEHKPTEQCARHFGDVLLYHCHIHSFIGCDSCCNQHRKTCKYDIKYIPEEAGEIIGSDAFVTFMIKLNSIADTSKQLALEYMRQIDVVEKCNTGAIAAIKAYKLEILKAADEIEKTLYRKAETLKNQEIAKLKPLVTTCLQIESENQDIATNINILQNNNQYGDLYITMVSSMNKILLLENELKYAASGNNVQPFNFLANTGIRYRLKDPSALGQLRTLLKIEHIKDINVKHKNNKKPCWINGSVLFPGDMLVTVDYNNNRMNVVDTKQDKVLSALTLSSQPWVLAEVPDYTVAVTLPYEHKITFVRTYPTLYVKEEIHLGGLCYGVAYIDRKLVVGFCDPHKVEVIDMKGTVLRRIETDGNGRALFNCPYYIAINTSLKLIYVSNYKNHNVVCVKLDGTVVAKYTDYQLKYPCQTIVDRTGNLFVCASGSRSVQMTKDCMKMKVLLTEDDGLSLPYTISYDENEERLYVGQYQDNNMKVYQLTYEYV